MRNHPFVSPPADSSSKQTKSPRSPKTTLENPLLKSSALLLPAPPCAPDHERSPEPNVPARTQVMVATPGPPPKASLSLNLGLTTVRQQPSLQTPSSMIASDGFESSENLLSNTYESSPSVKADTCDRNWVVAYGSRGDRETAKLLAILRQYGRILSTKSGENWIAVQYSEDISAARASARQLLPIGPTLCGVSRTRLYLLNDLVARNEDMASGSISPSAVKSENLSVLGEEDVLAKDCDAETNTAQRGHFQSLCERLCYWYFDWEETGRQKVHID